MQGPQDATKASNEENTREEDALGLESEGPNGREQDEPGGHRHAVRIVSQPGEGAPPSQPPPTEERPEPSLRAQQQQDAHKIKPDLRSEEVVRGSHPGDQFIRYTRRVGPFRRKKSNVLAASLETEAPRSALGRIFGRLKRILIGTPISTEQSVHERLTKLKALAVLSSDALSSVAYATEEILRILILAGLGAFSYAMPLGFGIIILLIVVVTSYRQTIAAYPRGGGSYIVAKDNLGTLPGLTAAAAILIGYILTVAVSVSAGIAALYSLFPSLEPLKVQLCVVVVLLVTVANLRGVREAGNIFAVPTYLFIVGMLALIAYGLLRLWFGVGGEPVYQAPADVILPGAQAISLLLLLRAFTQGATALTGVEAIADGVPAFKAPEAANARSTLLWLGILSVTMFGGVTFLAAQLKIQPSQSETVVSQIARTIFPPMFGGNPLWYFVQIATALILVLAANTAFSDFPRLSYFLARDKFMPHQYAFRGDRLAFSWGIVTLAVIACILIIIFKGDTSALIPLYAVGVFAAFTLSQSGMVVRWWRTRTPGWQRNMIVNGLGALTTFLVFAVSTLTKLEHGTWIVVAFIPVQIAIFLAINRHYSRVERQVETTTPIRPQDYQHTFVVPVSNLNVVARSALAYARSITPNVTAVHVVEGEDPEEAERFNSQWRELMGDSDIAMVIIESPYRSLIGPLVAYIDALDRQSPDDTITVVLPEFLPARPWEYLLHNQSAFRLKAALLFRPNTVVADMPYLLDQGRTVGARARRMMLRQIPWGPLFLLLLVLLGFYFFFVPK
jgi:amino acid transporter